MLTELQSKLYTKSASDLSLHRISPDTSHQTSPHQVIIFNSESALTPGCDASQHYSSTPLYTYLPLNTVPWIPQSLGSHSPLDLTLPRITKPLDLTTLDLFTVLWITTTITSLLNHFCWIYCLLNKVTLPTTSPGSTQSSGSTQSPGPTQFSGPTIVWIYSLPDLPILLDLHYTTLICYTHT